MVCPLLSPGWSGTTAENVSATYDVVEVVKEMLLRLSRVFPVKHFNGKPAAEFLEDYLDQRYTWQYALAEPYGPGKGGTIARVLLAKGVLSDLEEMVVATVRAIRGLGDHIDSWNIWYERWNTARGLNLAIDATHYLALDLALELECFAFQCANAISQVEFEYYSSNLYSRLEIPEFRCKIDEPKQSSIDAAVLAQIKQIPNEVLINQSSIDSHWEAEPGDESLKRSFQYAAQIGLHAWAIARKLRHSKQLPAFNPEETSWDFVKALRNYAHEDE